MKALKTIAFVLVAVLSVNASFAQKEKTAALSEKKLRRSTCVRPSACAKSSNSRLPLIVRAWCERD